MRRCVVTDAAQLGDREVVVVCVKAKDTAAVAEALGRVLAPSAVVVSFQNGVSNPEVLRKLLPRHKVLAGMVSLAVARRPGWTYNLGSAGGFFVEEPHPLVAAMVGAGLLAEAHANIQGVMWGKLLLNLNNAVNALSGLPARDQMSDPLYRGVVCACVNEALALVAARKVALERSGKFNPRVWAAILPLPTVLFWAVMNQMYFIGPVATSSMQMDLAANSATEVLWMNGEIVRGGGPHAANAKMVALVQEQERLQQGKPSVPAVELYGAVVGTGPFPQRVLALTAEDVAELVAGVGRAAAADGSAMTPASAEAFLEREFGEDARNLAGMVRETRAFFAQRQGRAVTQSEFLGMAGATAAKL
eukprot:TRINITY_DN3799_c0_g1_i2.p3 TRINITY_DN3799_c0_g1~~TRINITY_DN3799_c0_g1_i2.p3  ORF type:complete len:361 (-),score=106.87 TRINITY_DN3799_c0_g1_i2:18-1100(-)